MHGPGAWAQRGTGIVPPTGQPSVKYDVWGVPRLRCTACLQATRIINVVGACGAQQYECNGLCWDTPCYDPVTNATLALLTRGTPTAPSPPPVLTMLLPLPAVVEAAFATVPLAQVCGPSCS